MIRERKALRRKGVLVVVIMLQMLVAGAIGGFVNIGATGTLGAVGDIGAVQAVYAEDNAGEMMETVTVEGEDQKSEAALEELEQNEGVLLFADTTAQTLKSSAPKKDKVVLSYSRKIQYENFFTRNFRVKYDGKTKVAYCIQPKETPLAQGTWTAKEYNNKLMTKALYYSYGYPGYDKKTRAYLSKKDIDDDYEDDDGAYALSHLILSYVYDKKSDSSDAFTGVSSKTKKLVKQVTSLIEKEWPAVPDDSSLSLNMTSAEAVWDKASGIQKTPVFKLTGHPDNRINVPVPAGTHLIKTSGGSSKTYNGASGNTVSVKVYGGDTFYFTAADTVTGTYKSPVMSGVLTDFQPYLISVSGKQDIAFCGVGETDSVSFSVKWADIGLLELKKNSEMPEITSGKGTYSLKNAEYGLYTGNGQLYDTFVTDENGKASVKVPYGSYYLKEIKAPAGYTVDSEAHNITLSAKSVSLDVSEKPVLGVIDVVVQKKDKELQSDNPSADTSDSSSEKNHSQFAASLENAHYTVKYYDGYYDEKTDFSKLKPVREWVIRTNAYGKASLKKEDIVSGDDLFSLDDGRTILPLGTVTIQETKAPEGYLLDGSLHVRQIRSDGRKQLKEAFEILTHEEQIIRGDLKFFKQAEGDNTFLSGIPFRITSKSTGESAVIKTDECGMAATRNSGIWFGANKAEKNGDKPAGALPYDTYILDEVRCKENTGLQLIRNLEVVIDSNEKIIDLGILIDKRIKIGTTAYEKGTGRKEIPESSAASITDTVKFEGLEAGKDYVIKGTLMQKKNAQPVTVKGRSITGYTEFTAAASSGTVDVDFCFDSRGMEGDNLVVFEYLYESGELIAAHEDIDSADQTVTVMLAGTSPGTGDHMPIMIIVAFMIIALFGAICALRRIR